MSEGRRSPAGVAPASNVHIGRLGLTVPGRDRSAGARLAERVTEQLAARLPPGAAGHVGRLELTVRPRDTSEAAMTEAVVEAVLRSLPRGFR